MSMNGCTDGCRVSREVRRKNGVTAAIPLTRASPQEIVVLIGMTQGGATPLRFLRSLTIKNAHRWWAFLFAVSYGICKGLMRSGGVSRLLLWGSICTGAA